MFCAVGYYLNNGQCLPCSIIEGCFSCSNSSVCTTCSGSYSLTGGQCSPITSSFTPPTYPNLRVVPEYLNNDCLKFTLIISDAEFNQIEQNWSLVVTIQIIPPTTEGNEITLSIT